MYNGASNIENPGCFDTLSLTDQPVSGWSVRYCMKLGTRGWMENDPFAEFAVPDALQESLRRHREHLARLIVSLQSAGVNETQIETSVSAIVASYKAELMEAIKSMVMN